MEPTVLKSFFPNIHHRRGDVNLHSVKYPTYGCYHPCFKEFCPLPRICLGATTSPPARNAPHNLFTFQS